MNRDKINSFVQKISKAFTISSHGEIINEATGVEMEQNTKVLIELVEGGQLIKRVVLYDRKNKIFYDLFYDDIISEYEIKQNQNIAIHNFYLVNFNKTEQIEILKAYELFKQNHSFLYSKAMEDNVSIEQMRNDVIKYLKIYEIAPTKDMKQIENLTNLALSYTTSDFEGALMLSMRTNTNYDLTRLHQEYNNISKDLLEKQNNLQTKQVFVYNANIEDSIYLIDQHLIHDEQIDKVGIDCNSDEKWCVRPYGKHRDFTEENLTNPADIQYLYAQLENFRLNHPEIVNSKKHQKKLKIK